MPAFWSMDLRGSCRTHICDISGDIQNMGEAQNFNFNANLTISKQTRPFTVVTGKCESVNI